MESTEREKAVFEKRKWIGLTGVCNNKCLFCLDGDRKIPENKSLSQIKEELEKGLKENCTRLVLSGGEPTIHPDFLEIVKLAKRIGYKKIQAITNGRMFSYWWFLNKAVESGLGEITFSIHGHNSELHDYLTGVPGSFEQTSQGIENALKSGIIVNADIVINKKNIGQFRDIAEFLFKKGIREVDILHVTPYGNAWKNREDIIYEPEHYIANIFEGIKFLKDRGVVIWTNRFPPQCLEGIEDLMQDPYKILDEVRGRKRDFDEYLDKGKKLNCRDTRCPYCYLYEFCTGLERLNNSLANKELFDEVLVNLGEKDKITLLKNLNFKNLTIHLDKDSNKDGLKTFLDSFKEHKLSFISKQVLREDIISLIKEYSKNITFSLSSLEGDLITRLKEFKDILKFNIILTEKNFRDNALHKQMELLMKAGFSINASIISPSDNYKNFSRLVPSILAVNKELSELKIFLDTENIPLCMTLGIVKKPSTKKKIFNMELFDKKGNINIDSYALDYIYNKRIKRLSCNNCHENKICSGMFQKYIMKYGFGELNYKYLDK